MRANEFARTGLVLGCFWVLFGASVSLAQTGGSAIVGVAKDQTGGVLPGVTVEASSPALIEGTRTAVTDAAGRYQIIDLRPGRYDVSFTLQGFRTLRHEGIALGASFTATINAVLMTGTVSETVVVSGDSPLVDVRTSVSERSLNQELIENVPTGRGIFTLLALVPGATFNLPDVAGSQTHQLQSVSVHGSSTNDTSWRLDGLDISASLGSGGLSATYFNQGLQQEVSVQSKALSAEIGGGGVIIDMITKDGGNRFSGSAFLSYASDSLQADNVTSDQRVRGLTAPAGVKTLFDFNPSIGGPIIRDRLWFYASYRYWKNDRLVAQTFNTDGTQALDEQLLTFYPSFKITGRLNNSNRLSGVLDWNRKDRLHRRDRSGTIQFIAPEASLFQEQYGPTANVKWTSTVSSKLLFEAGFSGEFIDSTRVYQPGIAPDVVPKNDLVLTTLTGAAHPSVLVPYSISRARQWTVATSWMPTWKGQHNLRAGVQWRQMPYRTGRATYAHGDLIAQFRNGIPDSVLVHNTPVDERYYMSDTGIFLQDSWTIKRLTMNVGTRFERFVGTIQEQRSEAGTFVPERRFAAIENVLEWNTLVPRVAFVYDPFGSGRTALKVNASKYMQKQGAGILSSLNPMRLNTEVRTWTDRNLDGNPQLSEIGPSRGGLERGATVRVDPAIKRPYQWEYTVSVEHQLTKNLGMTVNYFHRKYYQLPVTLNVALSPSDFTPVTITNPLTGEALTVFNQNPATISNIDNLLTNSAVLDTRYRAFEITVDRRFADNFMVFGGFTIGSGKGCAADSTNPNALINSCGNSAFDSTYIANVSGRYRLPGAIEMSVHYQHQTGQPLSRTTVITRAQVPNLTQVNQAVILAPAGSFRKPSQDLLDLRFSRSFTIARLSVEPIVDLYNLTNENASLSEVQQVGTALGRISENIEGRTLRIGVRISF